ncbi:MAG: hypothetical protein LBD30_08505, partial [Verrucomicrobiales bacterium]|nr:hypothetical protein [Verrucomicrobiales bacterium]
MRLLFCLSLSASACFAQLQPWNHDTVSAWWQRHPAPDSWRAANDELKKQLAADYQRHGADAFTNSDFQHWLRHWQWVRLGLVAGDLLRNNANRDTFIALGKEAAVSHLFAEKILPVNRPSAALKHLLRIAQANPRDLLEYPALGVAYALVFDKKFQPRWPHHQVNIEAVPVG